MLSRTNAQGHQIDIHSTYTKHMKKITIVTAVAGVLAFAPLMTGCGGGEDDDANPEDDSAQDSPEGEGDEEADNLEVTEGEGEEEEE